MNVCQNKPVTIAGYCVYDINGGHFRAVNTDRARAKEGRPLVYPEYTAAIIEKEGAQV